MMLDSGWFRYTIRLAVSLPIAGVLRWSTQRRGGYPLLFEFGKSLAYDFDELMVTGGCLGPLSKEMQNGDANPERVRLQSTRE
jgi:hypothetical protein